MSGDKKYEPLTLTAEEGRSFAEKIRHDYYIHL